MWRLRPKDIAEGRWPILAKCHRKPEQAHGLSLTALRNKQKTNLWHSDLELLRKCLLARRPTPSLWYFVVVPELSHVINLIGILCSGVVQSFRKEQSGAEAIARYDIHLVCHLFHNIKSNTSQYISWSPINKNLGKENQSSNHSPRELGQQRGP